MSKANRGAARIVLVIIGVVAVVSVCAGGAITALRGPDAATPYNTIASMCVAALAAAYQSPRTLADADSAAAEAEDSDGDSGPEEEKEKGH